MRRNSYDCAGWAAFVLLSDEPNIGISRPAKRKPTPETVPAGRTGVMDGPALLSGISLNILVPPWQKRAHQPTRVAALRGRPTWTSSGRYLPSKRHRPEEGRHADPQLPGPGDATAADRQEPVGWRSKGIDRDPQADGMLASRMYHPVPCEGARRSANPPGGPWQSPFIYVIIQQSESGCGRF